MNEGIHYWRSNPRQDCPPLHKLTALTDCTNYELDDSKITLDPSTLSVQADASYNNDTSHRKLVIGIIARLVGGTIL